RYNARDTAIVLGRIHQAKVLMGTATPSIESYYNTRIKKYGLIEITERYQNIKLPEIVIANTREAKHKKQMKADLTPQLYDEIKLALDNSEQIILFQNRRGFSPYLECNMCGWIPYCNNCDVSLTYHKHLNRLICHYCGYSYANPNSCKACGSAQLEMKGFGTEKIESDIAILFPDAKIARMDLDSTRKKHAYDTIINNFENQKIDILIGTQMVTKGLDFDNVSLVGILNADTMLNFPDFRAFERSYQLMAQVSGRAGRKNKQGKVIIQTSNPNHPIIHFVKNNNYHKLFESQLKERKKFSYPPFYRLIVITVKHKKREVLDHALKMMTNQLRRQFKTDVLGPQAPLVSRIQTWYLKNYILKIDRNKSSQPAKAYVLELSNFVKSQPNFSNLQVTIDVDPQ
ncbi:primosomal protein N', partial [Bacteroidota bacterium]